MAKMRQLLILLLITFSCNVTLQNRTEVFYDTINFNQEIKFAFPDTLNNLHLRQLRVENNLFDIIKNFNNDKDKVLSVLNWTHQQWKHNGSNEPSKNDALTILKEAKEGKNFRCVEYGIVSANALQSLGYKARVLALKTKEVETTNSGAGHVLAEVWIPDFNKWALIDGQFNIMPVLNGIPLNAIEFQEAFATKKNYKLIDINGKVSKKRRNNYLSFIYQYLYHLDVKFDNRNVNKEEQLKYKGKTSLMLVPINAKNPEFFQKVHKIDYVYYTNSIKDFYQKP